MNAAKSNPDVKEKTGQTPAAAILGVGDAGIEITTHLADKFADEVRLGALDYGRKLDLMTQGLTYFGENHVLGKEGGSSGQSLAKETAEDISRWLVGADLAVVIAGAGKDKASSALDACRLASQSGAFTVFYFIEPFSFECKLPTHEILERARRVADAVLVISNDRVWDLFDRDISLREAVAKVNEMVSESIAGLVETLFFEQGIGWDFQDLVRLSQDGAICGSIGVGQCRLSDGVERAFREAVAKSFVQTKRISSAQIALIQVLAPDKLTLREVEEACASANHLGGKTECRFSIRWRGDMKDKISIRIFFCGMDTPAWSVSVDSPDLREEHQDAPRGIFSADPPNIFEDQDLDIPAFIRKGVRIRV